MLPPPPRSSLFPYTTLFRSPLMAGSVLNEQTHGINHPEYESMSEAEAKKRIEDRYAGRGEHTDRKSTRLNSSHVAISYAVFCLKKKKRAVGAVKHADSRQTN